MSNLLTIICSIGLLFQTSQILQQYLNKNTVINIEFRRNDINNLPAITVCYDKLFSFQSAVERYPEYKNIYENYTNFLKNYNISIHHTKNFKEKSINSFIKRNKKYEIIYTELTEKNFRR